MTQKPKLQPGQRVRIYDAGCFAKPRTGEVTKIHTNGTIDVRLGENPASITYWCGYAEQVRKLRPKQKPEKERGKKTWHVGMFSQTEDGSTTGTLMPNGHFMPPCFGTDLVTIEPGQVVLGREELARAWDKVLPNPGINVIYRSDDDAGQFPEFCRLIGLGKDKA